MKFEGWMFKAYEAPTAYGTTGQITVEFEGIEFFSGVKTDELSLVERDPAK